MTRLAFGAKCSGLITPRVVGSASAPKLERRDNNEANAADPIPQAERPRNVRRASKCRWRFGFKWLFLVTILIGKFHQPGYREFEARQKRSRIGLVFTDLARYGIRRRCEKDRHRAAKPVNDPVFLRADGQVFVAFLLVVA